MNKIRHYVLANLLTWLWVPLVLEKLFKKKLCVSYSTDMILLSFVNVPVNRSNYFLLDILPGVLWGHLLTTN